MYFPRHIVQRTWLTSTCLGSKLQDRIKRFLLIKQFY